MKIADKCDSCEGTGFDFELAKDGSYRKLKSVPEKSCYWCKGSGFRNRYTASLVCPYCGFDEEDSWETANEDNKHQCPNCEKYFAFETEHTREFISRRVDCLNGGKHKLGKPWWPWNDKNIAVFRCSECDYTERKEMTNVGNL